MATGIAALSQTKRADTVAAFDRHYGEMERVLWHLSCACRPALLDHRADDRVEALVATVRSWWAVRGVTPAGRLLVARALSAMEWDEAIFAPVVAVPPSAEQWACDRVSALVRRSVGLGVPRREVSLASKVLHWLLPWRVPIFDRIVRGRLGISSADALAYFDVAHDAFETVRALEGESAAWLGPIEPRAPLRGYDKCAWWLGGGDEPHVPHASCALTP